MKKFILLLFLLSVGWNIIGYAQEKQVEVTGIVTDAKTKRTVDRCEHYHQELSRTGHHD